MKKYIFGLILAFFLFVPSVFAYDLTLTRIGTMSTIGADYSLVSYVGAIPLLEGTATPAAQVTVLVSTTSTTVTAATSSGIWQFLPVSLSSGDNSITITSWSQRLSFVLRYNSGITPTPTVATSSGVTTTTTTLPETGAWEYIAFGLVAGVGVWYLGRDVKKRMRIWEKGV